MQDGAIARSAAAFPALAGHTYLRLTTFRKNGEAVPTPVWFAQVDDRVYVMTEATSGKVKRIHRNAQVEVAPCDMRGAPLGPTAEAMARVLPPEEAEVARAALNQKYGVQKRLFDLWGGLRRRTVVHLEITPM